MSEADVLWSAKVTDHVGFGVGSYVCVLTGLLAGRFTRQARKPADAQTGLADTVDAPASKSE